MKYQRISTQKRNKIFLCFSEDITASACVKIVGVNRNTVNSYYNRIRELIFEESLKGAGREFGEFECDESYFGAKRAEASAGAERLERRRYSGFLSAARRSTCGSWRTARGRA